MRNLQSLVQTPEKSLPFAISTGACKGVQQAHFLIAGTYLITVSLLIFSSCMSMMSKRQTSSSLLDRSVVMCSTFDFLLHLCEVALSVLHVYFETPLAWAGHCSLTDPAVTVCANAYCLPNDMCACQHMRILSRKLDVSAEVSRYAQSVFDY